MTPVSPPLPTTIPGYTAVEKTLLQAMMNELCNFISSPEWEQQLPFTVSRSFVMERLGNPVELVAKLYQRANKRNPQEQMKLLLESRIQGTGKEKWAAANGGFVLSHGSAHQVAAAIRSYHADVLPIQARLAEDYRGTFYNS